MNSATLLVAVMSIVAIFRSVYSGNAEIDMCRIINHSQNSGSDVLKGTFGSGKQISVVILLLKHDNDSEGAATHSVLFEI